MDMDIRDPVHGNITLTHAEAHIVDTPAFQRLRNIKQLGFGELSFPGATHTRYLHSLGAFHLSGIAFDSIFKNFPFLNKKNQKRLRQVLRLGALLHDVGHGPLSHACEEVMPDLKDLNIKIYPKLKRTQANHEDYTIKLLTDSPLADAIKKNFSDILPIHIACLIDPRLECPDNFFMDESLNFRPILSQIVSSELDVDRMDYLNRDSYFCGTSYGHIDLDWLISNLTYYQHRDQLNLAITRRALYTFDDFLISRHHMYLMIYFHHKSIVYDEMLHMYLQSPDCTYKIPSDIEEYLKYTDYHFYQHIFQSKNKWAQRISQRKPYMMIYELHETEKSKKPEQFKKILHNEGIDTIHASSQARLSKYHQTMSAENDRRIYVIDPIFNQKPYALEETTEIFQKYEQARFIERIYVNPEHKVMAQNLLKDFLKA